VPIACQETKNKKSPLAAATGCNAEAGKFISPFCFDSIPTPNDLYNSSGPFQDVFIKDKMEVSSSCLSNKPKCKDLPQFS
jgi:hypothetical protein